MDLEMFLAVLLWLARFIRLDSEKSCVIHGK